MARLWRWEDEGRDPWANAPLDCPLPSTCSIALLHQNRYGLPGLTGEHGYSHGLNIMQYLLYQSVLPADPVVAKLAGMRNRAVGPDRTDLQPIFLGAGGVGRT